MSILDFVKSAGEKIFKPNEERREVAIQNHLASYGITGIEAELDNHKVTLTGTVKDSTTREKAVLIAGNVEGIEKVDDRLKVAAGAQTAAAAPAPAPTPTPTPTPSVTTTPVATPVAASTAAATSAGEGWTSRTYTVKSGDTLSKISKEMYGDANKYSQIFEANKPMLKDPDKIYPGQVLRIPAEQ